MRILFGFIDIRAKGAFMHGLAISFFMVVTSSLAAQVTAPASEQPEAQTGCIEAKNVQIQGFHLGMRTDEVLRRLGLTRASLLRLPYQTTDKSGKTHSVDVGARRLSYLNSKGRFAGVHLLMFRFYNDRAYEIFVIYSGDIEWKNVQEYAKQTSEVFGLPESSWEYLNLRGDTKYSHGPEYQPTSAANLSFCDEQFLVLFFAKKKSETYRKLPFHHQSALLQDKVVEKFLAVEGLVKLVDLEMQREEFQKNKKKVFKP
jgi:hypothetical protein